MAGRYRGRYRGTGGGRTRPAPRGRGRAMAPVRGVKSSPGKYDPFNELAGGCIPPGKPCCYGSCCGGGPCEGCSGQNLDGKCGMMSQNVPMKRGGRVNTTNNRSRFSGRTQTNSKGKPKK